MGILDALRDPQFRKDVRSNARNLGQSASNTLAENVTMPVDVIAWALRKAGIPVPEPVGGSDWARRVGLTEDVPQGAPKMTGEALGLLAPLMGTKQSVNAMATALRQGGDNLANPTMLNKQAGVVRVTPLRDAAKINELFRQNEINERAGLLAKEWADSGENSNKIFNQIPSSYFDADGDLTEAGSKLYLKIQDRLAKEIAAKEVPKSSLRLTERPKLAADYAKWYADRKGVPAFTPGGSSKSSSTYLPVGAENASDALTMRFSTHELPEHYTNGAAFQFGQYEGATTKLSDIRRFIDGLKK